MYYYLTNLESCTCSPVPVEESSAESFSEIPVSVLSNLMNIAAKHCSNASETASCHDFRSGMMSEPLMAVRGAELLTSLPADFPARASAPLATAQGWTMKKVGCGANKPESLATFDPVTSSWKTRQCSLFEAGCECLATLPRWGMTVAGELYPLPTPSGLLELRAWITNALESGSWQRMETPTTQDHCDRAPSKNFVLTKTGRARHLNKEGVQSQERLSQQIKRLPQRLPTVTAFDATGGNLIGKEFKDGSKHAMKLGQAIQRLPTPTAEEALHPGRKKIKDGQQDHLSAAIQRLPTPTVNGNYNRKGASATSGDGLATAVKAMRVPTPKAAAAGPDFAKMERSSTGISLPTWVALSASRRVPTPTVQDAKNNCGPSQTDRDALNVTVGGPLNPEWVEWLMGWPIGWSSLEPMPLERFEAWLDAHRCGNPWQSEPDGIQRMAYAIPDRVARLTAIGNGQVPVCAAIAWNTLK